MLRALRFVKSKLIYFIVVTMLLGLLYGYVFETSYFKSFVTPTLFLMIYPMMINMKVTDLFKGLSYPKPLYLSVLINFTVSPVLAFVLGKAFFGAEPMLLAGLMLIALIPTSGMTASWTGLAGGNMKSSLLMISLNLILSIVFIPVYLKLLLGKVVVVNTLAIAKSLVKIVIAPLILGDLTRRMIIKQFGEKTYNRFKPELGGVSSLGVILIVFIAMALKSRTILNRVSLVTYSIIPLLLYYILMISLTHAIGKGLLDNKNKISLVYGTVMRNLTLSLGFALSAFGETLAVFLIAISYIIQVPLAAVYLHFIKNRQSTAPSQ